MKKKEKKKEIVVMVSGGFDPLHSEHVDHFKKAKKLGDKLVVVVDGDGFLIRKKGAAFMPIRDRVAIIRELRCVDKVVAMKRNATSAAEGILSVKPDIIAKGGSYTSIHEFDKEEQDAIKKIGGKVVFGVGGGTSRSSSMLLKRWVKLHK
jgi:cytidyltransferase-like protein